ncbi:MAG: hypothetical protein ACM3KR_07175 [Deltaproteobacteria bacterium]
MFRNSYDIQSRFPICRFSKDYIYVQESSSIASDNTFSDEITLHIMNTCNNELSFNNSDLLTADAVNQILCSKDRVLSKNTSAIRLQIPIGDNPAAFVNNTAYEDFTMNIDSVGWEISKWEESWDNTVSCSIISKSSKMILKEYECISVEIGNIISYCVPGATYIMIKLENVANASQALKTFHLLKKPTPLDIIKFTAADSIIPKGGSAKLTWKTAGKTKGKIIPNEFSIDSNVFEYKENLSTSKTYTLQIENEHESCNESCSVYVSPPIIKNFECDFQTRTACWETNYASSITINDEVCASSGSKTFASDVQRAVIKCEGYLYNAQKILYNTLTPQIGLKCLLLIFKGYTVIRLSWDSQKAKEFKLVIQEPANNRLTDLSSGKFEYLYDHSFGKLRIYAEDSSSNQTELYKSDNWK